MPRSKAKTLSTLFRSAIKTTKSTTTISSKASSSSSSLISPAEDATLKRYVSSLDTSSPTRTRNSSPIPQLVTRRFIKLPKSKKNSKSQKPAGDVALPTLILDTDSSSDVEESTKQLSEEISNILCGPDGLPSLRGDDEEEPLDDEEKPLENVLEVPWFLNLSHNNISVRRKEVSRDRKQKWVFKSTQVSRFDRLVRMCAQKLGTEATVQVFGKLGRETGVKEFNALIKICIEKAKSSDDEEVQLEQICNAFRFFKAMKEQGFKLEEETYGPFLMYLIDMGMVQEFHFFCDLLKDGVSSKLARFGYYEMLLWIRVDNEEKIQELCDCVFVDDEGDKSNLQVNYLLALCETDRKKEPLQLLEVIDITNVSLGYAASIFKSLGMLSLESFAEKFLFAFKTLDYGAENIANFIFNYVANIPNLAVVDVVSKSKNLHAKLELTPSSASYEKLITFCCESLKVHLALDLVDEMCEVGLTLSLETLHSILRATEESYEFNLVHRIYSMICHHDLKPNNETFRSMINLSVKMKDFDGAYGMLNDVEKMNLMPTAGMYNAIMAGYFREKNISGALMVRNKMKLADIKPDSQTFSYLIGNCDCEEDIIKYYEELKGCGVHVTKHVFMALINAYATCGQFEKAKQVVLEKGVPVKGLNEIKSVLVSALASHGQMSDAFDVYEEIKQAGCNLEPKAVLSLIEYFQSDGELSRLLQLLEELNDTDHWVDGCWRIILYCVRYKHISSAVDLLKQLKNKFCNDELATDVLFDEVFSLIADMESTHLQIGIDLLKVIKDELGLSPSRKCLDFLLSACVNAKDLRTSRLIWKEYNTAGLPYNLLSFLRMYQVLLASGDHKSAKILLNKIPKDDPHVRCIIKACQTTYTAVVKRKKQKNKEKN